jgi:hypothetical protein
MADKLHRAMRESAEAYGWTFAETHRRQFIDRGICAGSTTDGAVGADELRLPRKVDGEWKPYNPADFQAYASRQRWFRTPNDAFMTGNFHVASSVMEKVIKFDTYAWLQLLLASTYSGAFHPTAEGHAAIADAVAEKARVVLRKYGQGPDSEPELVEPAPPPPADEPLAQVPDVSAGVSARGVPPAADVPSAETPNARTETAPSGGVPHYAPATGPSIGPETGSTAAGPAIR